MTPLPSEGLVTRGYAAPDLLDPPSIAMAIPVPGMMDWGGWVAGPLLTVLFLALLLSSIGLLVRAIRCRPERDATGAEDRAMGILRERFASGEIDIGEFQARRAVLED